MLIRLEEPLYATENGMSSSSSPPSGGAGRSTRSGSQVPADRCRFLMNLQDLRRTSSPHVVPKNRVHFPWMVYRGAGGAITSSGLPRVLGPAEADLTFTEVRFSKPPGKSLKMVLPFQAPFVTGCFLPTVAFHWSSFVSFLPLVNS